MHVSSRWVAPAFAVMAVGLLPWTVVLALTLPPTTEARHWNTAWAGLDVLIAAGLAGTAWLAWRRDPRVTLPATVTATLLTVDAWFDVTTAAPGGEFAMSVTLAVVAELPTAALCAFIALRRPARERPRAVATRTRATAQVRFAVRLVQVAARNQVSRAFAAAGAVNVVFGYVTGVVECFALALVVCVVPWRRVLGQVRMVGA